jgi:hypothetical protein
METTIENPQTRSAASARRREGEGIEGRKDVGGGNVDVGTAGAGQIISSRVTSRQDYLRSEQEAVHCLQA